MPPHDVVVGVPVVSHEASPRREGIDTGVEIPDVVQVAPIVDNRDLRQSRATAGHPPGLIGDAKRVVVCHGPLRMGLEVDVPAAHRFVEVEEERFVDDPLVERGEPILDTHVVVGTTRERSLAVDVDEELLPEDVSHSVVDGASHPVRVLDGVVPLGHGDLGGAVVRGDSVGSKPEGFVAHEPHGPSPDRCLHVSLDLARFVIEKIPQGEAALLGVHEVGDGVGEGQCRHDPVEEPRIGTRDEELLHGATRTPVADRVPRLTVGLDEVLLDHHRGFGREHVVTAALRVDVQRR